MFDAEIKNPLQLLRGDKQDNAIFVVSVLSEMKRRKRLLERDYSRLFFRYL